MDIYETYNLVILEPESFEAASKQEGWVKVMEEINMIEKNNTWDIVDRPQEKISLELSGSIKQTSNLMALSKSTRQG